MDILVTGGSGFVGHWLQETQPDDLHVRYLNKKDYENGHWEWYDWDLVIHAANISPLNVLYKHPGRVLYISSGAIYNGKNEYAENKRKWEEMLTPNCVCARLFTFVGKWLKNEYAITKFIEAAKYKKAPQVWGDGSTIRTYLYGLDLGNWLWNIALNGYGIYDVGASMEFTMREVAEIVSKIYDVPYEVLFDGHPQDRYIPDITRALELGCVETVGLVEAIERSKYEG